MAKGQPLPPGSPLQLRGLQRARPYGWPVREDTHHIGAASDLLVETLQRVVRPDLPPVEGREAGEGQDVGAGLVQ